VENFNWNVVIQTSGTQGRRLAENQRWAGNGFTVAISTRSKVTKRVHSVSLHRQLTALLANQDVINSIIDTTAVNDDARNILSTRGRIFSDETTHGAP